MSNAIIIEHLQDTTVVRFNRPAERNPLSIAVLESLHGIVEKCLATESKRVVFTGVGEIFASGANLREIALVTAGTAREFALRGQTLMDKIALCESVAAVNGLCFGGAFDLALACRARFASPAAAFSHPGGNLGIMTGWGGTQRLPKLVGEATALEIFLTGKRVGPDEALTIGLIDAIVEDPLAFALKPPRG
ncbi:MAG: enoyl-CoA hydratase/isomerase family protein [Acidobacteria bacterium]|nr:enoyl-CoA hydratase/isomerase family protein [Acidobacteriota bacterium]